MGSVQNTRGKVGGIVMEKRGIEMPRKSVMNNDNDRNKIGITKT